MVVARAEVGENGELVLHRVESKFCLMKTVLGVMAAQQCDYIQRH